MSHLQFHPLLCCRSLYQPTPLSHLYLNQPFQSSRSPPTSSYQVPKLQSFPNDHRSSTDTPQILHQCSLSNQKAIDLLSLSSTEKTKSPVAASPPSMDRSPFQHTNHTTPPTSHESTPKCSNASSHLLHTKAHPNYIPATQLHPPSMKTLPSVGNVSLHPISMKAQQNFLQALVQNALQKRTCRLKIYHVTLIHHVHNRCTIRNEVYIARGIQL